jgi:hypothetical protein
MIGDCGQIFGCFGNIFFSFLARSQRVGDPKKKKKNHFQGDG